MSEIYRNKTVINQRGGSLTINNTTDNESIQISQRSGSNILLNNLVNSELASNNKQTLVINDQFETVNNNSTSFVGADLVSRVGQTTYNFKGFLDQSQIDAMNKWKEVFRDTAFKNSKFKIQ